MTQQQTTWKSQSGYIWSLIGSAVGFANILSFSAQVYKNGGAAFLIPYFIALLFLGIPMLMLEALIGYHWKSPLVKAYGRVWGQTGKVFGWISVLACLTIGGFYIVLTGYSVAYIYFSGIGHIPEDTKSFFVNTILHMSSSIHDFGLLSLPLFFSSLAVAITTWFVLSKQVGDGIEKICSIFMPLLVMIMTAFAVIVWCLPGGHEGWTYYLKPDFSKLMDAGLWRDVFGQLFFSLSLGLGIIVGYSRHTGQKVQIGRAMFCVAMGDFAVSFISGFVIFGFLAHISHMQNIPFDSILTSDSTFEIGFILFPKIFKVFGPFWEHVIGPVFFFCVFIAGITGVFSIVESISGNIEVEFNMPRKKAVTCTLSALMALGTLFCMGNGSYIIDAIAPMVLGTNMLLGGLLLIIAFALGSKSIGESEVWGGPERNNLYGLCIKYVAPTVLTGILAWNIYHEGYAYNSYFLIRWCWFCGAIFISTAMTSLRWKSYILNLRG